MLGLAVKLIYTVDDRLTQLCVGLVGEIAALADGCEESLPCGCEMLEESSLELRDPLDGNTLQQIIYYCVDYSHLKLNRDGRISVLLKDISQLKTPADCVAIVEQPRHRLQLSSIAGNLVLALDGVQNPGNLGTILRLADWFGVRDVICSKECADCFNPKVVQATMGAILRVRVHYVDNLAQVLNEAKNLGMPIYGTLLDGENIYSKRLQNRGVIVMGNEGRGLSDECQEALTDRLFIPPYPANCPTSESLNVAMATGIIIAEFRRGKYEAK